MPITNYYTSLYSYLYGSIFIILLNSLSCSCTHAMRIAPHNFYVSTRRGCVESKDQRPPVRLEQRCRYLGNLTSTRFNKIATRQGETETDRETDSETDRQTERESDRKNRLAHRQNRNRNHGTYIHTYTIVHIHI